LTPRLSRTGVSHQRLAEIHPDLPVGSGNDELGISRFEFSVAQIVDASEGGGGFRSYVYGFAYRCTD
jgi:hypothetical protein